VAANALMAKCEPIRGLRAAALAPYRRFVPKIFL